LYESVTVNHDFHFFDPNTGVHTNGVESKWCVAKAPIKQMRGISRDYLQSYLDEFCWRRLHKDDNQFETPSVNSNSTYNLRKK
jgi:hypothetical protein